jgi:voltage-gated potassium channel
LTAVRRTVYRILAADARDTALERGGNIALGLLILLNVAAVILETVEPVRARYAEELAEFDAFSISVFWVEYVLRFWSCVEDPRFGPGFRGRLRFAFSPMALIDLAVIVPSLLPGEVFWDLRFARVIRLVRLMRVFKFARYSNTLRTFGAVFRDKREEMALMLMLLLLLLVVSSSSMYFAEHEAQPKSFSSIPAAMWWSIVTLTTVGYGDIYPVTPWGKLIGAVIALLGIGFFALPAGILAAGFAEQLQKRRRPLVCPHCGKELGPAG